MLSNSTSLDLRNAPTLPLQQLNRDALKTDCTHAVSTLWVAGSNPDGRMFFRVTCSKVFKIRG